jgi:hypothetical protein
MEFPFESYGYPQRKWGQRECYLELDTFRTRYVVYSTHPPWRFFLVLAWLSSF